MSSFSKTNLKLSIVIAAFNDISLLEACLISLENQLAPEDTEIIVASNYVHGIDNNFKLQYPFVQFISLGSDSIVPMLRTEGIKHSKGEIVALVEDNIVFDERWCAEIKKAHQSHFSIIGGSVENASGKRPLDWAVYFYEYGKYMQPNQTGKVDSLAENNVTYKRTILENNKNRFSDGFFTTFINLELMNSGETLYLMPSAIAYHTKNYDLNKVIASCFHHGRSFAGIRAENIMLLKRILLLPGVLVLPILLPVRIVLRTIQKRRHLKELLLSLPHTILLMTIWAVGEFCGYAVGAGNSTAKWT